MIKIKISEILKEEFMIPLGITPYTLAKDTGISISEIQDILSDKREITVDISLRLAKYFCVSDTYFLDLQIDIDTRNSL